MSTYADALSALSDPTRRAIFEKLRSGPRAVGEIASGLPVSRPAVSQHLRKLEAARLVKVTPQGNRRVYAVDSRGLDELREWVDGFWDVALRNFKEAAER